MVAELRATLVLVDDIDRAVRFYHDGLGLPATQRHDDTVALGGRLAELQAGRATIWLYDGLPSRAKAPYPVLVLGVDDLDVARRQIEKHGGTITSALRSDPLGDHYIFRDTEGNILEIRAPAPAP
jgi:predicted enzyme related to lactoylglutathione lyase